MFSLPAVEITAENRAHVLGYGIEELPKYREMEEVIDFIRSSGGIAVAAHPFGDHHGAGTVKGFDAAEINGSVMKHANARAVYEAMKLGIPITGGSDAHFPWEIGRIRMEFDGDFITEVRKNRAKIIGKWLGVGFFAYKARRRAIKEMLRAGLIEI